MVLRRIVSQITVASGPEGTGQPSVDSGDDPRIITVRICIKCNVWKLLSSVRSFSINRSGVITSIKFEDT